MSFHLGFSLSLGVLLLSFVTYLFMMVNQTPDVQMANNGLLFVSNAAKAHSYCLKASKFVKKVLYVKINENVLNTLPVISSQISNIYSRTTSLDVRLIIRPDEPVKKIITNHRIDLILYDQELSSDIERLKQTVETAKAGYQLQSIEPQKESTLENLSNEPVKKYDYVALGGTFDRLHNGHKILLTQAALRSSKHVTVGVTDVNMIKSKKLWELIEPVEKRMKAILDFLTDINPDLEYNVLPIQDMYGPTKDDPKYQLLVVSEETQRGAAKINEKRQEFGLPLMDSYVIGLAADSGRSEEEEVKVSSSNLRMRLLGTVLKEPVENPNIPAWPYVIGLAGGIASGKSNIAEKLRLKGAAIVNCDFIAHDLYKPGLPLNQTIAETFGRGVIQENGEVDRRKLGQMVFSDKKQLEKLNELIWPAVIEEAERRVKALGELGHRVVVMEAAVMVRARWYTRCHQLWAVLIPPEEAIKRLQVRNNLTEEEARQRIESQPSNFEQVQLANVVFSPYWSYEFTQVQIDRAWQHLQEILDRRK